jgi:hypothetical protein
VNSCTIFTEISGFYCLLIVFLIAISLEFPTERFLSSCARETLIMNGSFLGLNLINGWYIPWVKLDKRMVHCLGWIVQEQER